MPPPGFVDYCPCNLLQCTWYMMGSVLHNSNAHSGVACQTRSCVCIPAGEVSEAMILAGDTEVEGALVVRTLIPPGEVQHALTLIAMVCNISMCYSRRGMRVGAKDLKHEHVL